MIGALYKNINKTNKLAGYKITFKKITIVIFWNLSIVQRYHGLIICLFLS